MLFSRLTLKASWENQGNMASYEMLQLAIIKLYLLTLYASKSAGMYMWFATLTFGSAHFLSLIWKHLEYAVCIIIAFY